jgi:ArsR family transcriptional regulator, arsenate/arsenite/antimonite-responsive transcriptional repressor
MKTFIRVMKALSEPNRVRMVKILGHQELCVCELQHLFGLAQSTVSKHMKILEEAGLVSFRKEGLWIIYRLGDGEESEVARALLEHLYGWLEHDPQLAAMVARLPQLDRGRICAVRDNQ